MLKQFAVMRENEGCEWFTVVRRWQLQGVGVELVWGIREGRGA
ncbi:hypothetical protein CsSME_00028822 [Camellia sinensis var. sinensis]